MDVTIDVLRIISDVQTIIRKEPFCYDDIKTAARQYASEIAETSEVDLEVLSDALEDAYLTSTVYQAVSEYQLILKATENIIAGVCIGSTERETSER